MCGAVLVLLLSVACGSAKPTATASISTPSSAPGATTASSSAGATTTSPEAAIPGGCPSGMAAAAQSAPQAAQCLYAAWSHDDRSSAAVFAGLNVVASLFETPWTAPQATFLGCTQRSDGGQECSYEDHGERYQFEVQRSEGGWRVTEMQVGAGG